MPIESKLIFTTREQLKEYIHSIHDFIRNSGVAYGMGALKIFNVFYSLKILDGKAVKLGLSEYCDWSYIKKQLKSQTSFAACIDKAVGELRDIYLNDNTHDHPYKIFLDDLYDDFGEVLIHNKDKDLKTLYKKICNKIDEINDKKISNDLKNIGFFIYHQIPAALPDEFCKLLFDKVDILPFNTEINQKTFDIKGKIYEYFIGRDKQAISDLGAYFTDRYLTNFIMEKLNPDCENGKVESMIDMFGGSGGFTIQYTDFINNKYKPIWKDDNNYKKIVHCDMAEDVIKIAGVEFYSITGHFPNRETQFMRMNSFKHEFDKKFKYAISNPPYGGDKSNKSPDILRKEAIIAYNKECFKTIQTDLNFGDKDFDNDNDFDNDISLAILCNLVLHHSEDFVGSAGSTFTGYIQRNRINNKKITSWKVFGEPEFIPEGPYSWNNFYRGDLERSWWREWEECILI